MKGRSLSDLILCLHCVYFSFNGQASATTSLTPLSTPATPTTTAAQPKVLRNASYCHKVSDNACNVTAYFCMPWGHLSDMV